MRLITKLWTTLLLLCVAGVASAATEYEVDQRFTSISDLDGKSFAIVDETPTTPTAMGIGITGHGQGWDMYFGTITEAYNSNACFYKLEAVTTEGLEGYYYLRTYKADGNMYTAWGNTTTMGYFNSQFADKSCCFALGLEGRNGQDGTNLAIWAIEESEGKFALKNIGTGLYLHADNLPAKYEDAFYFTYCSLKEKAQTDPLADQKDALNAAIAKGKMINAIAYTEATFGALTTAVTDGETALASTEATATSLTNATNAITNAIEALALKEGYTNLTKDIYKLWNSNLNPTEGSETGCAYTLFESTGQPYGDGSVQYLRFADISEYSKLILTVADGTPRIMMNRLEPLPEGTEGRDANGGAFVEIKDAPVDGVVVVDLTQYDYAHLNAIKGANWANVTLTGMYLYKEATVTDEDVLPIDIQFGESYNDKKVQNYTSTWTATKDGKTWTIVNFNNNSSGWDLIKCGSKNDASVATITSPAINAVVKSYIISLTKASNVNSVKLTIMNGEEKVGEYIDITEQFVAGDVVVPVESQKGYSYVLTVDNKKASGNGSVEISKITLSGEAIQPVEPTHITNTAETAYTVAKAIELIDAGEALDETVFIKGIVSKVDEYNDQYKNINYWISDDGTTESAQFECFRGKGIDGADFTSIDNIKVGATVIVKGTMKKYVKEGQADIYEFNQNNELVSYKAPFHTSVILTLKATVGEEVSIKPGVYDEFDIFSVDFGDGVFVTDSVGHQNKGVCFNDGTETWSQKEGTTHTSITEFKGTAAGDGVIKVYGNSDIWYLAVTGATLAVDQPKLKKVVQFTMSKVAVESLDLTGLDDLKIFSFSQGSLKNINVKNNAALTNLTINNNTASAFESVLESLDLSGNANLEQLNVMGASATKPGVLKTLDLSANTKLTNLYAQNNALESVILPENAALSFINLQDNNLESLDLTGVAEFKDIYLSNNKLTAVDLSKIKSGATINIDGNALTTLAIPVSIKTLNAKNNQLTSVSLVDATTQCNLDGNKFTLATLPSQPASLNTTSKTKKFTYAPQAALEVAETVTTLDLSSQVTVANGELDPADYTKHLTANTTFSFVTAGGTALVKGTDYKVTAPGKFQFIKAQEEKVHAVMQNDAFPKFTGANAFVTTEFTIEPSNAETELMAEAKTLAADAEAVAVGKLIDAIAAAEESCDETDLAVAVEQFKKDNAESSIDYTAKVGTGMDKWTGAGGTVASVTTKTGTNTPLAELYSSSGAGIKMSQKIEGLENGLYRVKVFATSHNARGEDGAALNTTAEDVAYVFATSGEVTNKTWITARGVSDWFVEGELTNPYTIEDIEVSNGELTIGLALDKEKQTGWHSIQIYSLESINTAKAAWAIVKAALQKNINAATDTLATGENGKAELEAAIEVAKAAVASNKLNVDEVVAANNVLEAAIHEFFEANLKIREDIYYVQETMTGKFLSRGAAWGTRAVVDDYGVPVELNYVPDNKYTIKGIDNNSTYGDDGDLYSDGNGNRMRTFIFNETADGYTLTNTNNSKFVAVNYSGADSLGVVANSETASTFKLLSVAEHDAIVAANKKAAEEAVIAQAGYKADDPLAYAEKIDTLTFKTGSNWTFTAGRDGSKTATNGNGTEVFQGTGNFVQNVEGLEAGLYKVTVQAMYRDGGNAEVAKLYDLGYNLSHAYLDANGSRVQVKSWGADRKSDSNPNTMDEFGALAKEGKYVSEGFAAVAEDGKLNLTVAVPSYIGAGWFIASQVTYQKVVVDSTALARTELEKAIAKAEATDTIQRTQETINTLKAAIEAAKALVAKEDATAEELVAATTAIEDAIAGLKIEPIEGIDYSWESPKGNPIEWGGTIAYVNGDGNRLNYAQANYFTICLNGKKANVNDETASANAGKMVITLDKAVAAGDTIAYTAFINKSETKKSSPYIIFENGTTAEGEIFGDEANIDATFNGVPTLKYTIVPAAAAGSKTITLTRSKAETNLFITKLQVVEKIIDPAWIAAKDALEAAIATAKAIETEGKNGADALATAISDAETALNDTEATIESFAAAKEALAQAISVFNKANLEAGLVEIAQSQSPEIQDNATRATLVEGEGYNTYTTDGGVCVIFKMYDVDVKDCDYAVVKFAEPIPAGIRIAFWAQSGTANVEIPAGATEYKYVFAEDAGCAIANDILPQITLLTLWNSQTVKVEGVYKHNTVIATDINAIATDVQNTTVFNMNGQKVNKAQKGLYIINGKKVLVK